MRRWFSLLFVIVKNVDDLKLFNVAGAIKIILIYCITYENGTIFIRQISCL